MTPLVLLRATQAAGALVLLAVLTLTADRASCPREGPPQQNRPGGGAAMTAQALKRATLAAGALVLLAVLTLTADRASCPREGPLALANDIVPVEELR